MNDATNPMAQAWLDAAVDLGIRVQHPFEFKTKSGRVVITSGVYLPDFGNWHGMLLPCRFDPDEIGALADDTDFALSALAPSCYEPYDREQYIDTLNDWGWFGPEETRPSWYTGAYWKASDHA
jgi:hypothetical protein